MKSQNERILLHLQNGQTLTQLEALRMFGCFRLGARIWELKKQGYKVDARIIEHNGKHISEYSLAEEVTK